MGLHPPHQVIGHGPNYRSITSTRLYALMTCYHRSPKVKEGLSNISGPPMYGRARNLGRCVAAGAVPAISCWLLACTSTPSHLEASPEQEKGSSQSTKDPSGAALPPPSQPPRLNTRKTAGPEDEGESDWTPEGGGQRVKARPRAKVPDGIAKQKTLERRRTTVTLQMDRDGEKQPLERRKTVRLQHRNSAVAPQQPAPPAPQQSDSDYRGSVCDRYNDIFHRLNWQTRRRECNARPDCMFMGRSVTGSCVEKDGTEGDGGAHANAGEYDEDDEYLYYYDEDDEDDDYNASMSGDEVNMVEQKLLATLVATIRQEGIEQPVRVLVTGSLAEAMTDSMRNGQKVTNQLAKELLMEVLEDPSTALALKHILLDGNLRSSTRGLIYWLLRDNWTLEETHKLVKWQLDGLLRNNMWTQKNLASTIHWVLGLKETEKVVGNLLSWSFAPQGPGYPLLVDLIKNVAPMLEDVTASGLQWSVHYALDDNSIKQAAKDSVKQALLNRLSHLEQKKKEGEEDAENKDEQPVEKKEGQDAAEASKEVDQDLAPPPVEAVQGTQEAQRAKREEGDTEGELTQEDEAAQRAKRKEEVVQDAAFKEQH